MSSYNFRGFSGAVQYLSKLCKDNDIVILSEHWLHANKLNKFEEISENMYYCARASKYASDDLYGIRRGQGCVAILCKKDMGGISDHRDIIHDRICGLRLQTGKGLVINLLSTSLFKGPLRPTTVA